MIGKVFVVDGPDGSGKSTAIEYLKELLKENYGKDPIVLPAIGGGTTGAAIRKQLMNQDAAKPSELLEALWMATCNVETIEEKVIPAINNGEIVILDRCISTFFAYQVYARQVEVARLLFNQMLLIDVDMFCYIYLQIPQEDADARIANRGAEMYLDVETDVFKQRAQDGFEIFFDKFADEMFSHTFVVNASVSIPQVQDQLKLCVETVTQPSEK